MWFQMGCSVLRFVVLCCRLLVVPGCFCWLRLLAVWFFVLLFCCCGLLLLISFAGLVVVCVGRRCGSLRSSSLFLAAACGCSSCLAVALRFALVACRFVGRSFVLLLRVGFILLPVVYGFAAARLLAMHLCWVLLGVLCCRSPAVVYFCVPVWLCLWCAVFDRGLLSLAVPRFKGFMWSWLGALHWRLEMASAM